MLLYQILHSQKNIKMSYKNNKFKTSAPTQNADIQSNFEYIFKKTKKD